MVENALSRPQETAEPTGESQYLDPMHKDEQPIEPMARPAGSSFLDRI